MCYFIDLLIHSANNEQASVSIADQLPTSTMGPERSVRASSEEIDSVLFSGEVAPSSKQVRTIATKHQGRGWASATQASIHRTEEDYHSKKPGWDNKLSKCKNTLARSVVESAFTKHTPNSWNGKRFPSPQGNIVPEKEVITDQGPSFNSV